MIPINKILQGEALSQLRTLPDGCVHTVVTSPPYWALRDYGTKQPGSRAAPEGGLEQPRQLFQGQGREEDPDQPECAGPGEPTTRPQHDGQPTTETGRSDGKAGKRGKKGKDSTLQSAGICEPGQLGSLPDATDTGCGQRQNGLHGQEPAGQAAEFGDGYTQFGSWADFPIAEPTICAGNDGLSERLHGITFSKWRNESIKAAGNAIVPQVVLQIYRAIEQYEKTPTEAGAGE